MDGLTPLRHVVVAVAVALEGADIPYAFGGAIALAYALEEPRATRDLDVNVFVASDRVDDVFAALPAEIGRAHADAIRVRRDDQVRLWWDRTPVDLFFDASEFHVEVARRCRRVPFDGMQITVLSASDLATFKVLFDRTKDWLDLELMNESGTLDVSAVAANLRQLLGDDRRIGRLQAIQRDS